MEAVGVAGRRYVACRQACAPPPHAVRLRRVPRHPDGQLDLLALRHLDARAPRPSADAGAPVAVLREYRETGASVLLGREEFGPVEDMFSGAPDPTSDAPLAQSSGPALLPASSGGVIEHGTLVEALLRTSHNRGDRGVTYAAAGGMAHESYAGLMSEAQHLSCGLRCLGLRAPEPVALQVLESRMHIRLIWACVLEGLPSLTVSVPPQFVPTNAVAAKLLAATQQLGIKHLLASDDIAAPLRVLLPNVCVIEISSIYGASAGCGRQSREPMPVVDPDDVLFYQLTSGSTGVPKVIPETHKAVVAHIRQTAQMCGANPEEETSLNWLPFDHVVPMLTYHFADVYLGRASVQVPTDEIVADPLLWLQQMAKHGVTHSWAPNFGFKLVVAALRESKNSERADMWDLSRLRCLMNAGEQVTREVCDAFLELTGLPATVIQPAFGMAETATCVTYSPYGGPHSCLEVIKESLSESSCRLAVSNELSKNRDRPATSSFVCLGRPCPGVEIRIVAPAEAIGQVEVLKELQIGRLQIRGPCVMHGYVNHPQANLECLSSDGWLDSGDLGFLHQGKLVLTGRAKEVLIVRGANFHCYEIEDVVGSIPGIATAHVAATSVRDERAGTEALLLFFVPSDPVAVEALAHLHDDGILIEALKRMVVLVRSRVATSFGLEPRYAIPLAKGAFPRTTSGKIMRGALRRAFLQGDHAKACAVLDLSLDTASEFAFPDFFAAPVWVPKPPCAGERAATRVLLFAPRSLLPALSRDLGRYVEVIPISCADDAKELQSLLAKEEPTHIVDASLLDVPPGLEEHGVQDVTGVERSDECEMAVREARRACSSLLHLMQQVHQWLGARAAESLQTDSLPRPTFLCFRYSTSCGGASSLGYEAGGASLASSLLKALVAEQPAVHQVGTVRIPCGMSAEWVGGVVWKELSNGCNLDMDIKYDAAGVRHVRRYRTIGAELAAELQAQVSPSAFRQRGCCYVVSGGLGELGILVVRSLLRDDPSAGCNILIVGRRLARKTKDRLQALGWEGRVAYASVDLGSDYSSLHKAIHNHLRRAGRPLGVIFHLAGSYARVPLANLDLAKLEASLRTKVWGAIHLHTCAVRLGARPTFCHFGSVATVYSGVGLGPYSAANAFLEFFARWQRSSGLDAFTIEWTSWTGVGISRRDESLGMASWLAPLSADQGIRALGRLSQSTGVLHTFSSVLVGIEWRDPELGCLFCDGPLTLFTPCLFYTASQCPTRELCVGSVPLCVPTMPLDPSGMVDIDALCTWPLAELLGKALVAPMRDKDAITVEPATVEDVTAIILETLETVCGAVVGMDADLFDAGLSSLTSARLRAALQKRLGLEIDQRLLLDLPGVRDLSLALFERLKRSGAIRKAEDETEERLPAETPDSLLRLASAMVGHGKMVEVEVLAREAAHMLGVAFDLAGLGTLLESSGSDGKEGQARRGLAVPLLKLASLVWTLRKKFALVASGYELLLRARGTCYADAPALLMGIARAHAQQGNQEAMLSALSRSNASPHRLSATGDAALREQRALLAPSLVTERIAQVVELKPSSIKTLVCLSLSHLGLKALPESVLELHRLQRLDVSRNTIETLPDTIDRLKCLQELCASSNDLSSLPSSLALLPQLYILAIQSNRFREIPEVSIRCRRLRELKCGAQSYPVKGSCTGQHVSTQLVLFEMEANHATSFPALNPENEYLGTVLASFNRLTSFPQTLLNHGRSLKKLHLGCNEISNVEGVFPSLPQLTELCLEGNRLHRLPPDIGSLAKLRELWVHGNVLATLPAELSACRSLTVLQAHHNHLGELPQALSALTRLQGLYLQSNMLSNLASLRSAILTSMPLQNLALGANRFNLCDAFELPDCRVGLGWNMGTLPPDLPGLSDRFAATDHLLEPACAALAGDLLLIAFSAQGPGMQQWHAPVAALRSAGLQVDALYVADPSNSFYLDDPSHSWHGLAYFGQLLASYSKPYNGRVLVVGSSMGATAALQHARLAARVLSFAPRVDLALSHGVFVPASARAANLEAIYAAVHASQPTSITVHVGTGNHVDLAQVKSIPSSSSVYVIEHDTFHHNIPAFLEAEGQLVPLLKAEVLSVLQEHLLVM